jgi:hypothetical protein
LFKKAGFHEKKPQQQQFRQKKCQAAHESPDCTPAHEPDGSTQPDDKPNSQTW